MNHLKMPRKFLKREYEEDKQPKEHEIFLSAFEKPTQIYRYLATRHNESPIFLHRNLSYLMRHRMSRKKNTRKTGLNYIVDRLNEFHKCSTAMLKLKFLSFYEQNANEHSQSQIEVETYLIKKRLNDEQRIFLAKHKVSVNNNNTSQNEKKENNEINIFINDFKNDQSAISCSLSFVAKVASDKSKTRYGRLAKVSKTFTTLTNEICICHKQNLCLTNGLYDVAFDNNSNKENEAQISNCEWQPLDEEEKEDWKFGSFLRFNLTLTGLNIKRNNTRFKTDVLVLDKPIIFQFLYGNYSQETSASDLPDCPWCAVNCGSMYGLLKHLRLCHERLCFKYSKTVKEYRIIVKVNQHFDASHEIAPHVYNFSRSNLSPMPKRKYTWTKILVHHSKNPEPNMLEFTKFIDADEAPLVQGHHRLYYHSVTGIPVYPKELNDDSENENDPLWLRDSVTNMVDAFRDVNPGEKDIMKLWNLHVLKYGYLGNCQMETACNTFVEERGDEIISKELYKNCLVHLSNLVDFEIITAKVMFEVVRKLQEKMRNYDKKTLMGMFNESKSLTQVQTKKSKSSLDVKKRKLRRKN